MQKVSEIVVAVRFQQDPQLLQRGLLVALLLRTEVLHGKKKQKNLKKTFTDDCKKEGFRKNTVRIFIVGKRLLDELVY